MVYPTLNQNPPMQNNMPLRSNCDRYDGDDVDILYVLETHGWSTCILYIGDTTHSIDSISHAFGFVEIRSKGSHHSFRNEIGQKVVIPKKGGQKVKGIYVKLIVDLLGLAAPDEIEHERDDETQNSSTDDE
jgi:predicted RNA binding protein YcfA (HicA-like mRNA interferase family)